MTDNSKKELVDKEGQPIHLGDAVHTKFRGGSREGEVEAIFTNSTSHPTEQTGDVNTQIKNPPKVVFTTQRGKQVAHNPGTLTHVDDEQ